MSFQIAALTLLEQYAQRPRGPQLVPRYSTCGQATCGDNRHVSRSKPLPTDDSKPQLVPSPVPDNQARTRRPPLPPSQGSLDLWDRGLQPNASLHLVPKDPSWRASSLLGDSSCPAKWQTAMCLISRGLTWETLEVSYLSFKGWRRPRKGDDEDDRSHGDVL